MARRRKDREGVAPAFRTSRAASRRHPPAVSAMRGHALLAAHPRVGAALKLIVLPTGRLGIDSLLQHVYLYSSANRAGAEGGNPSSTTTDSQEPPPSEPDPKQSPVLTTNPRNEVPHESLPH